MDRGDRRLTVACQPRPLDDLDPVRAARLARPPPHPLAAHIRGLGGVVVDGEVVVVDAGGCDFRRQVPTPAHPGPPRVTFVVFDLLAADGADRRPRPYRHRYQRLRDLLMASRLSRLSRSQLGPLTAYAARDLATFE